MAARAAVRREIGRRAIGSDRQRVASRSRCRPAEPQAQGADRYPSVGRTPGAWASSVHPPACFRTNESARSNMIVAMVSPDWQGCQGRTGWCCEAVLKRHALIDRNQCVVDDLDGAAADRRHRQGAIPVHNSALRRDKQRSIVLAPDVDLSHGRPGWRQIQIELNIDDRDKYDDLALVDIRGVRRVSPRRWSWCRHHAELRSGLQSATIEISGAVNLSPSGVIELLSEIYRMPPGVTVCICTTPVSVLITGAPKGLAWAAIPAAVPRA